MMPVELPSSLPPDVFLLDPRNAAVLRANRTKRRAWLGLTIPLAAVVVVLALGGSMLGDTAQAILTQIQLQLRGIQTQATIIGLDTIVTYVRGRPSDHYAVSYLFRLSDEDSSASPTHVGSAPITEEAYNNLREGDVIVIRYLPDDTDISSPISDVEHDYPADFSVSLIIAGIGLAGLYAVFNMWREDRRLHTQGRVLSGTIRSARGNQKDKQFQVTIHYAFRPPEGDEIEAYQNKTRNDLNDAVLPQKGTPVAVLYVDDKTFRIL